MGIRIGKHPVATPTVLAANKRKPVDTVSGEAAP